MVYKKIVYGIQK